MSAATILVVDDEVDNRELLEIILMSAGYGVVTAASGEDALLLVAARPPDLILLDVMLPGSDGYAIAAQLKADVAAQRIPIIMLTAMDDRASRQRGERAGAEGFLAKPFERGALIGQVKELLPR